LEDKIGRKAIGVAADGLVECLGGDGVEVRHPTS